MRIVFLHNASWIGLAIVERLLAEPHNRLLLVEPVTAQRDPELDALARQAKVSRVRVGNLRGRRFLARLRDFAPDLLIVATFPWKLPRLLRAIPRLAALNLHPSLLPAYRGAWPEFWAIRDGARETGVSLHLLADRFDAGPVLGQARIALGEQDTILTLTTRIVAVAPDLVAEVVEGYRRGAPPAAVPQDESAATRAPLVREHHLRIAWHEPAQSLHRLVRAAYRVFEAHATLAGTRVHVAEVAVARGAPRPLAPGELALHGQRLFAGTGDGALELVRLGALRGYEFVRAHGVRDGDHFD